MNELSARVPGMQGFDARAMLLEDAAAPTRTSVFEAFPEIIGRSPVMVDTLEAVLKIAKSNGAVLLLGESGTGKELIASAIHRLSQRAVNRYIAINCGAIPEDLLEAELFGYEKGAFTGADRKRLGYFGEAHRGTIFLDEIGDMPLRLQVKLLRVLQEKRYSPLGGNHPLEADVRIIAATNVDLVRAVQNGKFREDLFYRLNVLPVFMAPLRERGGDIMALLSHFLVKASIDHGMDEPCQFTNDALKILHNYRWPGNVRELQNVVERAVVLSGGGMIGASELPREILDSHQPAQQSPTAEFSVIESSSQTTNNMPTPLFETFDATSLMVITSSEGKVSLPTEGVDLQVLMEMIENTLIIQALERTGNNKNQAAKLLGLNRTTLVERLKKRKIGFVNGTMADFKRQPT
ncbi:MAG: sigma 54-interacting transcriptional regulator [Pseudomonadota bacterium]